MTSGWRPSTSGLSCRMPLRLPSRSGRQSREAISWRQYPLPDSVTSCLPDSLGLPLSEHVGVVEGPEWNDDPQEDLPGVDGSRCNERDRPDEESKPPHG